MYTLSKKKKAGVPIMENMVTISSNLKDAMVAVWAVQSTMQPMPLSQGITAAINFMDNHKNVPESLDPWLLHEEICQMLNIFQADERAARFYNMVYHNPDLKDMKCKWVKSQLYK